jgi:hypothetical protein
MAVENDPSIDESVARRVRKLLDKAEGTSNPHEAEAFSRKAAEIAARHRIDPDRLAATGQSGELGIRSIHLGRGAYVRARLSLLVNIAEVHDVRVVFQSQAVGTVALCAGFNDDLDVVEMLYNSLHQQASAQMARRRSRTGAATQQDRRSFLFGFANRVGQLLAEAAAQAQKQSAPTRRERKEVALALRQRAERVQEYSAQEWGRVRKAQPHRAPQARGWSAGSVAAERADLGRKRVPGARGLPAGS